MRYEGNPESLIDRKELQRRLELLAAEAKAISRVLQKERAAEFANVDFITPVRVAPADSNAVRREIRMRRWRDTLFPEGLFADPAWDLLLDLYGAHLEGTVISVTSACIAASVPQTTALRWIMRLQQLGLVMRADDGYDHRRRLLYLSDRAVESMNHWAASVMSSAASRRQGFAYSKDLALA